MESLRAYHNKKNSGFTLVEILLALAIITILATGMFVFGAGQYKGFALISDRDTVISMLYEARERAMNNIDQSVQGFSIQPSSYVIFEGTSYLSRVAALDKIIPRSSLVTITGTQEFVFNQLSGELTGSGGNMVLNNGSSTQTITIGNEGRITW